MPMPAAARRSSALAPMPGTVRSGGGCGELLLLVAAEEDELRRDEAAQATEGGRELREEEKGSGVDVAKVWREPIDADLRSALAAAPREGLLLLLLPRIPVRAANVARGGLCGAEAATEAEATGEAEAVDDEILIAAAVDEKQAAIDGRTDDDGGKGESSGELLLLLLLPRRELLLMLAESAATSETRRVSFLDRRERIRCASLSCKVRVPGFFLRTLQTESGKGLVFSFLTLAPLTPHFALDTPLSCRLLSSPAPQSTFRFVALLFTCRATLLFTCGASKKKLKNLRPPLPPFQYRRSNTSNSGLPTSRLLVTSNLSIREAGEPTLVAKRSNSASAQGEELCATPSTLPSAVFRTQPTRTGPWFPPVSAFAFSLISSALSVRC